MENTLKQRIVGAIVLIALAVIFLPSILKEKSQQEPFQTQIPAKPEVLVDRSLSKESQQEIQKTRQALDKLEQTDRSRKELEKTSSKDPNVEIRNSLSSKDSTTPKNENEPPQKPAQSQVISTKSQQSLNDKPVEQPQTISPEYTQAAWIIQVAAFSSKENAIRLVEKLKLAGHKAYRRDANKNTRNPVYRVYAGPYIKKTQAEASLEKVNSISQTKGLMLPFDPTKH
ncbi:SPOR domain-containing protein [Aliikangiella sp. G2MR2-5]|uniref:SPOR domain-containing protein n=1 Tax=Aliikangiella sp. G2MR2-5 TaxID=2788943 RepID=UPI0018ABBDE8|nr:SPOR domain-containing protein [Aliikangiella sp. G2MR2-5]